MIKCEGNEVTIGNDHVNYKSLLELTYLVFVMLCKLEENSSHDFAEILINNAIKTSFDLWGKMVDGEDE